MAYTCDIYPYIDKLIFPDFSKTVFNIGKANINSKVSQMFRKFYSCFHVIVQQYIKMSKVCVKPMVKSSGNNVITCFEILYYAANKLSYASVTIIWIMLMVYIRMLI